MVRYSFAYISKWEKAYSSLREKMDELFILIFVILFQNKYGEINQIAKNSLYRTMHYQKRNNLNHSYQ